MITFDDIQIRLDKLGLKRSWLAEASGRSASSIRSALAPNAPKKQRSELLQKALSDAIEREEERRMKTSIVSMPVVLPDRVTIECKPEERRNWQAAAMASPYKDFDKWAVVELNKAAAMKTDLFTESTAKVAEDEGKARGMPAQKEGTSYQKPGKARQG
jgi:hypothetical protein